MDLPLSYHPSPLDETIPPIYYAIILAFPVESADRHNVLRALQEGYSKLHEARPYLAGNIVRDSNPQKRAGSLKLIIPDEPIDTRLDVADLSACPNFEGQTYASIRKNGMPPSLLDSAVLAPYVAGLATPNRVFSLRVNWIDNGCLLAISASHAVFDAQGAFTVVKNLAHLCRSSETLIDLGTFAVNQLDQNETKVATDLSTIHNTPSSKAYEELKSRPEVWNRLGLHADNTDIPVDAPSWPTCLPAAPVAVPQDPSEKLRTCIFSFSVQQAATLKAAAAPSNGEDWISTKDAYTAHIWASLMRARFGDNDVRERGTDLPVSSVNVAIDGRKIPEFGFAPTRLNNTVYCCQPKLPLSTVLGEGDNVLPMLAANIRRAIETAKSDQDLIRDANTLAATIPNVGSLAFVFKDFVGIDFVTTSWSGLGFYGLDFGSVLGKPQFVRMPRGQFGGACCMLPQRTNGELEVMISGRRHEIERLLHDEKFLKYTTFVCE